MQEFSKPVIAVVYAVIRIALYLIVIGLVCKASWLLITLGWGLL